MTHVAEGAAQSKDTFSIGSAVRLTGTASPVQGVVRFCGCTSFSPGEWYGIELEEPIGKNDGCVRGVRYFTCKPNHGVFVRGCFLVPAEGSDSQRGGLGSQGGGIDTREIAGKDAEPLPTVSACLDNAWPPASMAKGSASSPKAVLASSASSAAAMQRELAEAMEDQDAERIRCALPAAIRARVPLAELEAAQGILNFRAHQVLHEEVHRIQRSIAGVEDVVNSLFQRCSVPRSPAAEQQDAGVKDSLEGIRTSVQEIQLQLRRSSKVSRQECAFLSQKLDQELCAVKSEVQQHCAGNSRQHDYFSMWRQVVDELGSLKEHLVQSCNAAATDCYSLLQQDIMSLGDELATLKEELVQSCNAAASQDRASTSQELQSLVQRDIVSLRHAVLEHSLRQEEQNSLCVQLQQDIAGLRREVLERCSIRKDSQEEAFNLRPLDGLSVKPDSRLTAGSEGKKLGGPVSDASPLPISGRCSLIAETRETPVVSGVAAAKDSTPVLSSNRCSLIVQTREMPLTSGVVVSQDAQVESCTISQTEQYSTKGAPANDAAPLLSNNRCSLIVQTRETPLTSDVAVSPDSQLESSTMSQTEQAAIKIQESSTISQTEPSPVTKRCSLITETRETPFTSGVGVSQGSQIESPTISQTEQAAIKIQALHRGSLVRTQRRTRGKKVVSPANKTAPSPSAERCSLIVQERETPLTSGVAVSQDSQLESSTVSQTEQAAIKIQAIHRGSLVRAQRCKRGKKVGPPANTTAPSPSSERCSLIAQTRETPLTNGAAVSQESRVEPSIMSQTEQAAIKIQAIHRGSLVRAQRSKKGKKVGAPMKNAAPLSTKGPDAPVSGGSESAARKSSLMVPRLPLTEQGLAQESTSRKEGGKEPRAQERELADACDRPALNKAETEGVSSSPASPEEQATAAAGAAATAAAANQPPTMSKTEQAALKIQAIHRGSLVRAQQGRKGKKGGTKAKNAASGKAGAQDELSALRAELADAQRQREAETAALQKQLAEARSQAAAPQAQATKRNSSSSSLQTPDAAAVKLQSFMRGHQTRRSVLQDTTPQAGEKRASEERIKATKANLDHQLGRQRNAKVTKAIDFARRKLCAAAYDNGKYNWAELFHYHDHDKSGAIDFEEFRKMIRKAGKVTKEQVSDEDMRLVFDNYVDLNGDNLMNYATEFLPWVRGDLGFEHPHEESWQKQHEEAFRKAANKERAEELKAQRNEKTQAALKQMKHKLKASAYSNGKQDFKKLFREGDQHHHGFIDFDDFRMLCRKRAKVTAATFSDDDLRIVFDLFLDHAGTNRVTYKDDFLPWLMNDASGEDEAARAQAVQIEAERIRRKRGVKEKAKEEKDVKKRTVLVETKKKLQAVKEDWAKLFREADEDKSGALNLSEFRTIIRTKLKISVSVLPEAEFNLLFNSFLTADGDNCISYETEFLPWLKESEDPLESAQAHEACIKIQSAFRASFVRKSFIRYRDACKSIQRGVRKVNARQKTDASGGLCQVAKATQRRYKALIQIFDLERQGDSGLNQEAFRRAVDEVHPHLKVKQVDALFHGYVREQRSYQGLVDCKGFCAIVEAVAVDNQAAAEFADMSAEEFTSLGQEDGWKQHMVQRRSSGQKLASPP